LAGPVDDLDIFLLRELNDRYNAPADTLNGVLSNDALVMATPLVGALVLGKGHYRVPIRLIEAQVLALGMSEGLKLVLQRDRPYVTYPDVRTPAGKEGSFSLPSTHATLAFAGATIFSEAYPSWSWPAYGWATLVSISRVYNGVHYPTDVLAGALVGVGAARLSRAIFRPSESAWGPAFDSLGIHPAISAEGPAINWSMAF
jgi:undecaprenyl-diphosphatase